MLETRLELLNQVEPEIIQPDGLGLHSRVVSRVPISNLVPTLILVQLHVSCLDSSGPAAKNTP